MGVLVPRDTVRAVVFPSSPHMCVFFVLLPILFWGGVSLILSLLIFSVHLQARLSIIRLELGFFSQWKRNLVPELSIPSK